MMISRTLAVACALSALVAAAACGGVVSPSKNRTETLTGAVMTGGVDAQPFSTSKTGEYSITLTSLDPPVSAFVTVFFGQVIGGQCSPLNVSLARIGREALVGQIFPGNYCAGISDDGKVIPSGVTLTYTLSVSHP